MEEEKWPKKSRSHHFIVLVDHANPKSGRQTGNFFSITGLTLGLFDLLTRWEKAYSLGCRRRVTFYGDIDPIFYYTPQIIKTLLEDYDADPNTPYGIKAHAGTDMTSLERLNTTCLLKDWDPDKTENLCLQFARDPRTNLNSAINFDEKTFFPGVRGIKKLEFPDFPTSPARINLLGQAFLFNNTTLISFLLTDKRVNPALPAGSAENLIIIARSKVHQGFFCNDIPALKDKLLSSRDFYDVLMHRRNTRFRQEFLDLIEISPNNRYLPFISHKKGIYRQEQDRKIAALYPAFQPDSGGAAKVHPGKKTPADSLLLRDTRHFPGLRCNCIRLD